MVEKNHKTYSLIIVVYGKKIKFTIFYIFEADVDCL